MSLEHLNKAIRHYEQNEYDKALPLFKQLAEQGAAEGQYNLGRMYLHGYGVTKDYQKAIEWFHKAVEQGNVDAQPLTPTDEEQVMFCEATIHYDRKEYDKAFLLYKQVAKGNYTELSFFVAMRLGKMYLDGKGTTKDEDEAMVWYRKSAEMGNTDAQYILGAMYFNIYLKKCGTIRIEAHAQAMVWFHKAAEQGHDEAQAELAEIYFERKDDTKINDIFSNQKDCDNNKKSRELARESAYQKSLEFARKSAKQGNARAQLYLGYMYYNGYGIAQDKAQALVWFRKSAEQGNAKAKAALKEYQRKNGLFKGFYKIIDEIKNSP